MTGVLSHVGWLPSMNAKIHFCQTERFLDFNLIGGNKLSKRAFATPVNPEYNNSFFDSVDG